MARNMRKSVKDKDHLKTNYKEKCKAEMEEQESKRENPEKFG